MKTYKQFIDEMAAGAGAGGSSGPANAVSTGAIAGTGGKGGEPGVHLKKKKSTVMMDIIRRKKP